MRHTLTATTSPVLTCWPYFTLAYVPWTAQAELLGALQGQVTRFAAVLVTIISCEVGALQLRSRQHTSPRVRPR